MAQEILYMAGTAKKEKKRKGKGREGGLKEPFSKSSDFVSLQWFKVKIDGNCVKTILRVLR